MIRGLRLGGVMAAGALLGSAGYISAAPLGAAASGPYICSGTPSAPGVLSGSHGDVNVSGVCFVNAGPAVVHGIAHGRAARCPARSVRP